VINPKQIKIMYKEELMTIKDIARYFGVRDKTISEILKDNNVKILTNFDRSMLRFQTYVNRIKELYCDEFKTMKQVAKILGITQTNVINIMDYYEIPKRKYTNRCSSLNHGLICEKYVEEKMSTEILSKIFDCSQKTINNILTKNKVKIRSYAEASSIMNDRRTIDFSDEQKQFILGSMLGDACLNRQVMKSNKTGKPLEIYRLIFAHSIKQLDYLKHKKSIIGGSKIGERISHCGATIKHFAFCHTPSLRPIAKICHDQNHKKQVTKQWLDQLDWRAIAYWYMDDGTLITSNNRPIIKFHTNSFSTKELKLLMEFLADYGLQTRKEKTPNPNPDERILASRHKKEALVFLEKIRPYIIPSMEYKIRSIL